MFSNESTESLNTTIASEGSPCSVRKPSSAKSSQELLNLDLDVNVAGELSSPSSVTPTSGSKRGSLTKISPLSVPNFKTLLMKSEMAEQNGLQTVPELANGLPRSDSACTFQSYDASSRSSNASTSQVAKSSSVNPRLIDLAEESTASSTAALNEMSSSDEFSSLSGYESIGNEEDIQGGSDRLSFANPNYVGPEKTLPPPPHRPLHQLTRDESHQSFAQALNSPADSLYSDYQDFQARLSKDFVEMPSRGRPRPKSVYEVPPPPSATTNFVVKSPLTEQSKPLPSLAGPSLPPQKPTTPTLAG